MLKCLVMTAYGWVGAINFDSIDDALKGVKHFLNKEEDRVRYAVTTDSTGYGPAFDGQPAEQLLTKLMHQGKCVAEEMISDPEHSWDPTEFLRKPLLQ